MTPLTCKQLTKAFGLKRPTIKYLPTFVYILLLQVKFRCQYNQHAIMAHISVLAVACAITQP